MSVERRFYILLGLILCVAAFLRIYQLTIIPPGLYHDEAINGNDALRNLETGTLQVFYPQNGGREGLYINLITPLIALFGTEAWVLRLPAVIFGILTVWGVYLLAAELFGRRAGLLASFFLATSFWHINFSRIGLRTIGSPLFLAWGLWLLLDAVRRVREGRPATGRMVLAGVVYGLGFHTYIAYRATPLLVTAVMLYGWRKTPALLRPLAAFAGAAGITVSPLLLYFAMHRDAFLGRASEVSILARPGAAGAFAENLWKLTQMIFTRGDFNWRHNIAFKPMVFWPVAILFALGCGLSVYLLYRRKPEAFPYAIAIGWLAVAAVPAALTHDAMPHALRSLLMAPAVMILAGAAGSFLYDQLAGKLPARALVAATAVLATGLSYEAFHSYFDVWAKAPQVAEAFNRSAADIAARINSLPDSTPKYVVAVSPGAPGALPSPAQTIMFLTRSYTTRQQEARGIRYIPRTSPDQPDGVAYCQHVAASLTSGELFCLQVNRSVAPSF